MHSSQPPQRAAEAELKGDVGPVAPPARLVWRWAWGGGRKEQRDDPPVSVVLGHISYARMQAFPDRASGARGAF